MTRYFEGQRFSARHEIQSSGRNVGRTSKRTQRGVTRPTTVARCAQMIPRANYWMLPFYSYKGKAPHRQSRPLKASTNIDHRRTPAGKCCPERDQSARAIYSRYPTAYPRCPREWKPAAGLRAFPFASRTKALLVWTRTQSTPLQKVHSYVLMGAAITLNYQHIKL